MSYLEANATYWERGYRAENVDAPVFRFYGRVLVPDFGLDGAGGERLLDFGCGEGSAVNYFRGKGFDAYGVDISHTDLTAGAERWPELEGRLERIGPAPAPDDRWFGGGFQVITAIQSLYYFSDTDLDVRLASLYDMLEPGGVLYATMMGTRCYFYEHSRPADDGLREVVFDVPRFSVSGYFVNFVGSEDELVERFSMFEPRHVGYYADKFRSDEGEAFHYTFVGVKS